MAELEDAWDDEVEDDTAGSAAPGGEGEAGDSERLAAENAQALGDEFDPPVSDAAIGDLDEQGFETLLREREGEPLNSEQELQTAFEARKRAEALAEFTEFARQEMEKSRALIAGLTPEPEAPEEPAERAYGDLSGLSEREINAIADARLIDAAPYAEQMGRYGQNDISSLRPSEVVEEVKVLDEGRFSTKNMTDEQFLDHLAARDRRNEGRVF